mgnify:CR=1 FL=1
MGKKLISDKTKNSYKKIMNKVTDSIGKVVYIYFLAKKSECPNCYYDNTNEKSSGKCKWSSTEAAQKQSEWESQGNTSIRYKYFVKGRCPVCSGVGFLKVIRRKSIKCVVNWGNYSSSENEIIQTPAGKESETNVLLKTDPKFIEFFRKCDKIKVDGVDCELSDPPIVRGIGNDSVLLIIAYSSEKLKEKKQQEVVKNYYD